MALVERVLRSKKYSIRDPETLRLFGMFGWQSAAGIDVSPETALAFSAVYCATKLISESIGSLPLPVYQRQDDGGKSRARTHPLYRVMQVRPNFIHTPMEFWTTAMVHLICWGNFYAEIDRDPMENVVALWPLPPDRTEPFWIDAGLANDSQGKQIPDDARKGVGYKVQRLTGGRDLFTRDRVLHIGGLGFNGLVGRSVIRQARESIGLGIAQERLAGAQINNGQRPGIGIKLKGKFEDMSREEIKVLKESFVEKHSGIYNAGQPVFLEEGMDLVQFSITPHDAQFLESRQFTITEIARWFNMPPHKLKDLIRATFSNIEEQNIEWVQDTLRPWCVRIEQAVTTQLLKDKEQDLFFAEYIMDAIMRGNTAARADYFGRLVQSGILTPNEVRAKENYNPIEGMNVLFMPLNMIAVGGPDHDPQNDPEAESGRASLRSSSHGGAQLRRKVRASYKPVIVANYERILRGTKREVLKLLQSATNPMKDLEEYMRGQNVEWMTTQSRAVLMSLAEAVYELATDEIGAADLDMRDILSECMDRHVEAGAQRASVAIFNRINKIYSEATRAIDDNVLNLIAQELDDILSASPGRTATWESVRVDGLVTKAVSQQSGFIRLGWDNTECGNPFCTELADREVEMNGECKGSPFVERGAYIYHEGKKFSPTWNVVTPPLTMGCNCSVFAKP